MSIYNNDAVRSENIDPVTFSSSLCVFKFDANSYYYPNLRISNLACDVAGKSYSKSAGVFSMIKNIRLMDGKQILCSMRDANFYMSFKNLLTKNSFNQSYERKLKLHALGYEYSSKSQIVSDEEKNTTERPAGGYVHLMDMFDMLSKVGILNTHIFQNLRLEIEFEKDLTKILTNNSAAAPAKQPILVVDRLRDEAMALKIQGQAFQGGLEYDDVELDSFDIAQSALDTTVQKVSKKVQGFDNKYVSRVVMMKNPVGSAIVLNGNDILGYGPYSSFSQQAEKLQIRCNGSNLYPADGLSGPNSVIAHTSDVWGSLNIVHADHQVSVGNDKSQNNSVHKYYMRALANSKQNSIVGESSYFGSRIEDRVVDLQFEYERQPLAGNDQDGKARMSQQLLARIFGEVRKTLVVDNKGNYKVLYV